MPAVQRIDPPRLSLTIPEAAASLGVSVTTFRERVLPELKVVCVGTARLIAIGELTRWVEESGMLVHR